MKKFLFILVATFLVLSISIPLFAAGQKEEEKAAEKQLTFLFVPGVTDPFYYTMARGAQQEAKKLGVNLIISEYAKAWGPEYQVPIMESAVARKRPDLIIIAPTSTTAITPLKRLYDQGIEIITVDTYLGNGDYSKPSNFSFPLTYIGTDNTLGGKKMAEHLAKMIGEKGEVYVNTTNPDVLSVMNRVKGFKKGIAEFQNIKLVGVDYNLDVQQKAQAQTLAALQAHPDIKGIFGTNLYSAQGAYQGVVQAGLTGAVKIVCWDASVDLINALKAGKINLLLAQKPAQIGSLAVEWGYKYFKKGTKIPKKVIPGFEFFTKENVNNPDMQKYIYKK